MQEFDNVHVISSLKFIGMFKQKEIRIYDFKFIKPKKKQFVVKSHHLNYVDILT